MSDVRPELQQIRERLRVLADEAEVLILDGDKTLAALAQVEATLNEQRENDENYAGFAEILEAAEARVVAAEAERDEALGMRDDVRTEARLLREANWKMTQVKREAERRAVAAEAERDAAWQMLAAIRDLKRHDLSMEARLEVIQCCASAALASATGASGAPQDTARPAPAEPPREEDA